MHKSQKLWRALSILLLITALCGSFSFPGVNKPAKAAPQIRLLNHVVISEVRFHGSGGPNDEFVEIFNPTGSEVNLNGWKLDANSSNRYTFTSDFLLQPGQHFLLAQSGFDDGIEVDAIYLQAIADDGGIALIDQGGNIVDQVGLSTTKYFETNPLLPLTANIDQSYDRDSINTDICKDTDDNSVDFFLRSPSDPQNSRDPLDPPICGNPTATATGTATATSTATATGTATATAIGPSGVIINEVAWSGTSASTTDDEWIELYNPSSLPVDITGWHLYGDDNVVNKVGSPNITLKGTIAAKDYFLLEKNEAATTVTADQVYTTGDLLNGGERLYLKNSSGTVIDTANLDGGAWPAGTASVTTTPPPAYASMERVSGITNTWVTYSGTQPVA
jgi:hypothetical protein